MLSLAKNPVNWGFASNHFDIPEGWQVFVGIIHEISTPVFSSPEPKAPGELIV